LACLIDWTKKLGLIGLPSLSFSNILKEKAQPALEEFGL
jgi:hypothetical protein